MPPRYKLPAPDPETNDPPWIQTITGRRPPSGAGVQTLRVRQSSECSSGSPPRESSIKPATGGRSGRTGRTPGTPTTDDRARRSPPAATFGGTGIGNAGERPVTVPLDASDPATPDLDDPVPQCALQLSGRVADVSGNLSSSTAALPQHEPRHVLSSRKTSGDQHFHLVQPMGRERSVTEGASVPADDLPSAGGGAAESEAETVTGQGPAAPGASARARP